VAQGGTGSGLLCRLLDMLGQGNNVIAIVPLQIEQNTAGEVCNYGHIHLMLLSTKQKPPLEKGSR